MEKIKQDFEQSNFFKHVGMEVENVEKGSVTLKLPIIPEHWNVINTVHGGVYATILDTAMGFTTRSIGYDEVTTLEMSVHFLKAIQEGTIYAKGNVIHENRSTVLVEADLFDEDGDRLAHSTGTFRAVKFDK